MSNQPLRLPADHCCICQSTLEDIGGKRIIAQKLRGVTFSDKHIGGGNPDYPMRSIKLPDDSDALYMSVWGEPSLWSDSAIERAKNDYIKGFRPWMCQKCSVRLCSKCEHPINAPVGSDVLYDSGCSSHIAMLGYDPGCSNVECEKFKEWG